MQIQQGDISLFQTNDNGDISVVDGVVEMSGGLQTSTYLSLFGGNIDDDGLDNNKYTWWANIDETEGPRRYVSETQNLLRGIPATPNNLKRIEDAVFRDLGWMITERVASSVSVETSMPGLNRIKISVNIEADGAESRFEFVENWKADA